MIRIIKNNYREKVIIESNYKVITEKSNYRKDRKKKSVVSLTKKLNLDLA